MATTSNITRRAALKAAPAIGLVAAVPATANIETPQDRITRLVQELGAALMAHTGARGCDLIVANRSVCFTTYGEGDGLDITFVAPLWRFT